MKTSTKYLKNDDVVEYTIFGLSGNSELAFAVFSASKGAWEMLVISSSIYLLIRTAYYELRVHVDFVSRISLFVVLCRYSIVGGKFSRV